MTSGPPTLGLNPQPKDIANCKCLYLRSGAPAGLEPVDDEQRFIQLSYSGVRQRAPKAPNINTWRLLATNPQSERGSHGRCARRGARRRAAVADRGTRSTATDSPTTLPTAPTKVLKNLPFTCSRRHNHGRLGRHAKDGVYSLGGVRLWNSDISCNSSPSGYRPVSRCT